MYPSADARQLAVLLRISRALDIVGDVSVRVDDPSELLAWAVVLPEPKVVAWRARDSEKRYVQVAAHHQHSPIHGNVAAVVHCDQHRAFWDELMDGSDLEPGAERPFDVRALSTAWAAMPLMPPT
jgi:hypothetical protein